MMLPGGPVIAAAFACQLDSHLLLLEKSLVAWQRRVTNS